MTEANEAYHYRAPLRVVPFIAAKEVPLTEVRVHEPPSAENLSATADNSASPSPRRRVHAVVERAFAAANVFIACAIGLLFPSTSSL